MSELLTLMGIPIVQAKSEGEAQAVYMVKKGDAWAVGSQDYDSILYGAPILVRNLTIAGKRRGKGGTVVELKPEIIYLEDVLKENNLTLEQIIENARIAIKEEMPICQDTGFAVVFIELGQDVHIVGGNLIDAINEGVRKGYKEGYLRKSVVEDPLKRKNTNDNTPAEVHIDIVNGDRMKITVMPKGAGSENVSKAIVLPPALGLKGLVNFIVDSIIEAGGKPCPPIFLGIGIGGSLELAAKLAKKAHLKPIGLRNPDPQVAELEEKLLNAINELGIGPMGLGGRWTALDVKIEIAHTHTASLPIAISFQCWALRRASMTIS